MKKRVAPEGGFRTKDEQKVPQEIARVFKEAPGDLVSKLENFPKYIRRQKATRFIALYEIFKRILPVKGSIIECGVYQGFGLMTWANLSAVLEPNNLTRRIYGFDTFEGFKETRGKDKGKGFVPEQGDLKADSYSELLELIRIYDSNRFLGHVPKVFLVKGDATVTIPKFVEENKHLVVSLLFLDMDLFERTKVAIEQFFPRMPKGAIIAFDELDNPIWPGETMAVFETVGMGKLRIERFDFDPYIGFAVIEYRTSVGRAGFITMDWKVKYIDYPYQYRKMRSGILDTVDHVLGRGDVMLRQQLKDFEVHLAEFVGTKYAVGFSNCTDGLHLSLRAAGIGQGHEVITVSHTFVATAAAIHHAGAVPVLVDIGDDHNMNVDLIEEAITERTKAIIPVHLNGRLCKMDKLMNIAERHGLVVIEDAAQALGGSYNGIKGGAFGIAGCFSFYPAKLLGAYGDAGAVVTNSREIAGRLNLLRNHGRTEDNDIAEWSFNCRMDNLHAAILDLKLGKVPEWIERRREIAKLYHQNLVGIRQLLLPLPPEKGGSYFDVFQNYEIEAEDRDGLFAHLKKSGIETLISWGGKGVHQFRALGLTRFRLPRTEEMFKKVLMLPMHCELTDDQVHYTSESIRNFYRK